MVSEFYVLVGMTFSIPKLYKDVWSILVVVLCICLELYLHPLCFGIYLVSLVMDRL